jgi:RNA polymerase sigma-70 factor (ECF subfamily)
LRLQDGDAWSRLAKLYGPLVYGWCRRRGLQDVDAADVVQEVFRSVAASIKSCEPGSFRGWLWTITRSKLIDHFRKGERQPAATGGSDAQARLQQIPEALDEADAGPGQNTPLVKRALDMIRPDFEEATWQAFWRVVMEDQKPADVARSLGISANAVYIAKSRVLRRLRDELGEDFF